MLLNELEFQTINTEFHPKLHRYLTHLVGAIESEDLTQEVFVKISKALQDFRGESQLSTWIYRIATNATWDKKRSRTHRLTQGSKVQILSPRPCPWVIILRRRPKAVSMVVYGKILC